MTIEMEKKNGILICRKCCGVEDVIVKDRDKHLLDYHDWDKI